MAEGRPLAVLKASFACFASAETDQSFVLKTTFHVPLKSMDAGSSLRFPAGEAEAFALMEKASYAIFFPPFEGRMPPFSRDAFTLPLSVLSMARAFPGVKERSTEPSLSRPERAGYPASALESPSMERRSRSALTRICSSMSTVEEALPPYRAPIRMFSMGWPSEAGTTWTSASLTRNFMMSASSAAIWMS